MGDLHDQAYARTLGPAYLLGWGGLTFDADGTIFPLFRTGLALSNFSNDKLASLLEQARVTMDRAKRLKLYAEASKVIKEEVPCAFIYQQVDIYGVSERRRDVVDRPCVAPGPWRVPPPPRNEAAPAEAVAEARAMLGRARRPVVLAGVEIHSFGLQRGLLRFLARGFPIAATLLGKSVVRETHPQYLGAYEGAIGREDVRRAVEGSDCLLLLGAFLTDIDLGMVTPRFDEARTVFGDLLARIFDDEGNSADEPRGCCW